MAPLEEPEAGSQSGMKIRSKSSSSKRTGNSFCKFAESVASHISPATVGSNPARSEMSTSIRRATLPPSTAGSGWRKGDHPPTKGLIQTLREDYGVTQNLMVRLSGYSPRSIANWASGTKATKPATTKFMELTRLFSALAEMAQSPKDVIQWLQEPNEAFDGSTPLQVIERGESDRIWRMIYFLRSGEPL